MSIPNTTSQTSAPLPPITQRQNLLSPPEEFMDTAGRYTFRAYLSDSPPDDQGPEIMRTTLRAIIQHQQDLTNGQLYDELHRILCGPEPFQRGRLLRFMILFAAIIREHVSSVAEAAPVVTKRSSTATFKAGSHTGLTLAQEFPEVVKSRLVLFAAFQTRHPLAAQVYELFDFVECTDLEICQLLGISEAEVKSRRNQAIADIRRNDP